jgi:photosystem II stability/assembly factor-like uncharacterized protein
MSACVGAPRCVTAGVNEWTPIGPDGGRAYDVEFSHTSPGTFYAIGLSGVYRSTVAGDSFELLNEDLGTPFDLAVDPARADRVLVAAQGLHVGAGSTWTRTTTSSDQGAKVATSRDGSTVYFAAAGARIFRSQDRGMTWQERAPIPGATPAHFARVLEVDPGNPDVVYASVFGMGLFVSTDGGAVWQPRGGGDPTLLRTWELVVDPSSPQRLLVATNDGGLRISNDGGLTWNATAVTGETRDVDVDPFDPSVIYVSGADVRKSTDGGASWRALNVDQPPGSLLLAIDPTDPSRLAAFNGQGVSVSTDSGETWAKRIAGFKGTNPTAFSALPSSRRSYFGLSGPGAVFYVEDGAAMVRSVNNDPLTLLAQQQDLVSIQVLALPGAADTLYAVLKQEILAKSTDAGLHWSRLAFPGLSVAYIAGSPREPQTLYASGSPGPLYKSMDGGATWATIGAGLPADFRVEQIAIASAPSTLYAIGVVSSAGAGSPPSEWRVYRSADAGATWSAASPLQTRPILSVTVDPRDAQVVYAGIDSELRKTTDGGATWTTLSRNGFPLCCSFRGVVFDATDTNLFYALHAAVLRTVDGGASWENVFTPSSQTFTASGTLVLDPTNASRLLVGWSERGVREFTIAPDLALTITAPTSLTANAPASYTLALRNLGPFHATNVRVTAQTTATVAAVSANAAGAACTTAATTATCTFELVRSGASAAPMTFGFVPAEGSVAVSASTTGNQPDPLTANNVASSTMSATVPAPPPSRGGGGAISPGILVALILLALRKSLLTRSRTAWPQLRAIPLAR